MKYTVWGLLLFSTCLQGAVVTWDDEATKVVNGEEKPEHRWHTKKNWAGDSKPAPTDDVRLLSGSLVELFDDNAVVNTINSQIPLHLGKKLTITSSGTFRNIGATGIGWIRANGPVTFDGTNNLSTDTLEGSGTFKNKGLFHMGTRGIHPATSFENEGEFFLISGITNIGIFNNSGTFDFGEGSVGVSTKFHNRGILKEVNSTNSADFFGELVQSDGKISVADGAVLTINNDIQQYKGGEIVSDGTLLLTGGNEANHSRTFEGLMGISGGGVVEQLKEFKLMKNLTVNMPNAPGYQFETGLAIGNGSPSFDSATFTNTGIVTINNSPRFIPADEEDEASYFINRFVNSKNGKVIQDEISNPSFRVIVLNEGEWTSYGMKMRFFENSHKLFLKGDGHIDPEDLSNGGVLCNSSEVQLGSERDSANFTISTEYVQESGATTYLTNGELRLEGGSQLFGSTFTINRNSTLRINRGDFYLRDNSLTLKGMGTVTIGGNQLTPQLHGKQIFNLIGRDRIGAGLFMRSGRLDGPTSLVNWGIMKWSGGTISGILKNYWHLDILAGPLRVLDGTLLNGVPSFANQHSSLTLTSRNATSKTSIDNCGVHFLHKGASISGDGQYNNRGTLICKSKANVAISCAFTNFDKDIPKEIRPIVRVEDNSVLGFTNCTNISETGELKKGEWKVEKGSKIIFLNPITVLTDSCSWTGPGAKTVFRVDTFSSLTKNTNEVHHVGLEVKGTVCLVGGTTTTIPSVDLNGGEIGGSGELVGDLNVGSGSAAPGDSAGTLTITGNTSFTSESTYEWEADSLMNSDLLQINTGTATLAGTVRPVLIDGYIPLIQSTFTILNAPTVVGTFDQIDDTALPGGMTATLGYTGTSVTMTLNWTIDLTTYDDWKAANFTAEEQADELISGNDSDPDKDTLTNLQEYTFGTLPKSGNGVPVQISDATDEYIELTFPWVDGISDVFFQMELGNDLETFSPTQHTVVSSESTDGITQYVIRIDISDTGTPGFVRLRTILNEF